MSTNPAQLPVRIPVAKAAQILGRSEKTLYRLAKERRVPHYRVGANRVEFVESELIEFIQACRQPVRPAAAA